MNQSYNMNTGSSVVNYIDNMKTVQEYEEFLYNHYIDVENNEYYYNEFGVDEICLKEILYFLGDYLNPLLNETYLENIESEEDIQGHFYWCYKKAAEKFAIENSYKLSTNHDFFRDLIFGIYKFSFYDEKLVTYEPVRNYFTNLFDIKRPKTLSDVVEIVDIQNIYLNTFTL